MEFVEAVNPHYAFPIVGVIVCCLLVFAFGFKSPGQPPSFDIVDEERNKVVKKRKAKESQKQVKPQQNGKITSTTSTKAESIPHTPKGKVITEKPANKSESKATNKKSRSQQVTKQTVIGNKREVVQSEDGNEDGWVQLVSKKERKNRKKDDVAPISTEVCKVVPASVEAESFSLDVENSDNTKEDTVHDEQKKLYDTSESAVEKESSEDTKSTQKAQRTPKKKKGKKEEMSLDSAEPKELAAPEVSELPKESGINVETKSYSSVSMGSAVTEPPANDLLQVCEMADSTEEEVKSKAKKKKNKKKNQDTIVDDKKTEATECAQEHSDVLHQQTIPEKEIIIEPEFIDMELQDTNDRKAESEEPAAALGSNVAFDELKDLCPEEKPQRKKKKVRREH